FFSLGKFKSLLYNYRVIVLSSCYLMATKESNMSRIKIRRWAIAGIILAVISIITWSRSQAQNQQNKNISYGQTVDGTVKSGMTDEWHFTGTAGEIIAFDVERSSGALEPSVTLEDPANRPVAGTQAAKGQGSASLMLVRLPQSGPFTIQISGNNKTEGDYHLT